MCESIRLRAITAGDEPFLRLVYASTRVNELAITGWDQQQIDAFLGMQFDAQKQHYGQTFPNADYRLVVRDQRPIGRLSVNRAEEEIRVIDISLLPEARCQGIGSMLIAEVLAEGAATGQPVRLHVEKFSRAQPFYQRLGFYPVGESGSHVLLEWTRDHPGAGTFHHLPPPSW